MKLQNLRLSTRITIAALFIVVAGGMALMFAENARFRDVYTGEHRADLEQRLHSENLRLNQATRTLHQDVLFLSDIPPVSGMMRAALNHGYDARDGDTSARWAARLNGIFSAFSTAHPDYYQIRYIGVADGGRELGRIDNRNGRVEIMPPARLMTRGDQDYFKAALALHQGQVWLSEFILSQDSGGPPVRTLRAVTPVFAASGKIFGMVVLDMDAGHLLESASLDLPSGVQAHISDMDGRYLLHPDARQAFRFEPGSKEGIRTDYPSLETMFDPQAPDYLPLQAAATGTGRQLLAAERIHFDPGHPERFVLLSYGIPAATAAQQIVTIPPRNIVGGLIAMLLLGGGALLMLRKTIAPMLMLRNRALMQNSTDGIHVMDVQGNIVAANEAFCRMLGYTKKEVAGLNVTDWNAQFSGDELRARFKDHIGKSDLIETVHRRKDGTLIDVEISVTGVEIDGQGFIYSSSRDITGRKKVEDELRLAAAVFDTHDAIVITDADANIIRVNKAFTEITGYSPAEVLGKNPRMMSSGRHDQAFFAAMWQQLLRDGSWSGEIWDRRKDGQVYPRWMTISAVRNEQHEITQYVGIFSDISAYKQAEEAILQESEERFRGTLEQAAVGILHVALDGSFQRINDKFCEIVGYPHKELIRLGFREITFPADLGKDAGFMQQMLAGEISTFAIEKRYVRKDLTRVWVNLTVSMLRKNDGTPKFFIFVVQDITERKRAELELGESRQLLRELVAQGEVLREEERKHIAREIHDELGQILTALRMDVALLRLQYGVRDAVMLAKVQGMTVLLDRAIQGVRNVASNLRPTVLDMGIVSAVEWLCDEFAEHTGVPCVAHLADSHIDLDETHAVVVFRIVQESLTNVARHAEASSVEITLAQGADVLHVSVRDNGKGFDPADIANRKSFGLLGMSERAIALGGTVEIASAPQQGTVVSVRMPTKSTGGVL